MQQAANFSMNIIQNSNNWPQYLIYDNGCSLSKYVSNVASQKFKLVSERSYILLNTKIVVDRFHFSKHSENNKYCKEKCNPDDYDQLKNVNTEACEQTNYWLSGYKHATKHMNDINFYFFCLLYAMNIIRRR